MKRVLFLVLMGISVSQYSFANDYDQMCDALLKLEREYASSLPKQLDSVTWLTEFRVDCESRLATYVKHVTVKVDIERLNAAGGNAKLQRMHTRAHCQDRGFARHGWSVDEYIYDNAQSLFSQVRTTPEMCSKLKG